ncbi:MAG: methionyl-tRNA formyltransferase [Parcubacteria bacterium C7867-003]|nr:MAG: methionyl-tRNA formyltransferase [Parcubacteria bacterium C7867-003]
MQNQEKQNKPTFAYFGTSKFAVYVLEELKKDGLIPSLIITTEDKPKGRKLVLTPPEVKVWAENEKIKYIQPNSLKGEEIVEEIKSYSKNDFDVFIVCSYGKIIPKKILEIPKFKTLNVHPSLLPKLRGPSPLQSAILSENETGVTIMRLDEEVDHGPILAQEEINIEWPPHFEDIEKIAGQIGGKMLSKIINPWISGEIVETEQNHELATFTKKIEKKDSELDLRDSPETNLRKIRAYSNWPGTYFFEEINKEKKRVIVKKAHLENNALILDRVIPEGKKEMDYLDFLRGIKN